MRRVLTFVLLLAIVLSVNGDGATRRRALLKQRVAAGGGSSTLNTGITAYWKLDEASGTRVDSGSNGQDLTDNNTVGSAAGKINNAGDFEESAFEYLSRADSATMSLGADTDFTFCAWVNIEAGSPFDQFIINKSPNIAIDQDTEYLLKMDNATFGYFRFGVGNGSSSAAVNATTMGFPSTSTWYFIVCWHDSTANTINIQVNNGTADSTAWSGGTQDAANAFEIGAVVGIRPWDGLIDEVGFWKRVLTADERTELYNSGNAKTCCPF